MKRKNGFLTFCFAFIPGFGQMYQGYMKRGVSILFWAILVIVAAVLLNMGVVAVLLIGVWAYSFFDTFNLRNLTDEQRAVFYDDTIPGRGWLGDDRIAGFFGKGRGAKVFGWVLVAVGALILYNNFVSDLLWRISPQIAYQLPSFLIGVGVVVLGVLMLRRPKNNNSGDDEIIPFGGNGNDEQR